MAKKNKNDIIDGAIAGGVIGAALGAILTGESKDTIVSALVGAAIGASIKAQEEAQELQQPVLYEEKGAIYKVYPNGEKELVRKIKKNRATIPTNFSLD